MEIYITKNGASNGPYTPEQVQHLLREGYVTGNDLGWRQGFSEWRPLHLVLGWLPPAGAFPPSASRGASPYRFRKVEQRRAPDRVSVGGWLLFYGIMRMFIGPLVALWKMSQSWEKVQPAFTQYPVLKSTIMWEDCGMIILLLYGFAVGFEICRGNPRGREIAKTYLTVNFFVYLAIEGVALYMTRDLPTKMINAGLATLGREVVQAVIAWGVWLRYFTVSQRVLETYGPEKE